MTIHIVVDVDVLPGRLDDARAAFRELAAATLLEAGCLQFDVFVSEEEDDRLVLVEAWADQDAIDLHMKEECTARFLQRASTVFPHPPRARRIRPVDL
jgi:quinol monooxygenase YgiN